MSFNLLLLGTLPDKLLMCPGSGALLKEAKVLAKVLTQKKELYYLYAECFTACFDTLHLWFTGYIL